MGPKFRTRRPLRRPTHRRRLGVHGCALYGVRRCGRH